LQETLTAELPNLVQMDVSLLSGLLAKKILQTVPDNLNRMFFCNSGSEAVEAAIKFARYATRRPQILYCEHSFHGLTLGSLSLNGEKIFRDGFGALLPDCESVPFNDLTALENVEVPAMLGLQDFTRANGVGRRRHRTTDFRCGKARRQAQRLGEQTITKQHGDFVPPIGRQCGLAPPDFRLE